MSPLASLDDYGFLLISSPVRGSQKRDSLAAEIVSCAYRRIYGNNSFALGAPKMMTYNEPTQVNYTQFVVICREIISQRVTFEKAFVHVPLFMKSSTQYAKSNWEYPSMALLLFDSVSLNHFKRNLPRTWKFLVDNNFITMNLYNEVSDDVDKTMRAILGGGAELSGSQTSLWNIMKERRCMTYLSEEIGEFPSLLGKMVLDVDYDLRPYYAYTRSTTNGFCTREGHVASYEHLNVWKRALLHLKEYCHFSMHYVRTLTRINADFLSLLDEQLRESLETFKANGLFEDTVFALISGRGNTMGMKDELFITRVEERSPLFSIRLPDKFLGKHHHPHALLNSNANRLVATRDIGLTLKDIASVNFVFPKSTEINKRLEATSLLSYELPTYRSCEDTLIPPHLCLCMDEKSLQIEGARDLLVYKQLFEYVKGEMLKYDCVQGVYKAGWEVTVLSLNSMVQQGIKDEKDWKRARKKHLDMGMNYVDVNVVAFTRQQFPGNPRIKIRVRMRFRDSQKSGFEPVGELSLYRASGLCFAERMDQFCDMCYYNTLVTE